MATETITSTSVHDIQTNINYWDETDVDRGNIPGTAAFYRRRHIPRWSTVKDIRDHENDFKLDVHGFEFRSYKSEATDLYDEEQVKSIYYPEVEALVKSMTGATRIHIIGSITRRNSPAEITEKIKNIPNTSTEPIGATGPSSYAHVDQSYDGARTRVPFFLPNDAERLLKTRFQIINIWRPLRTVHRDPLAVVDARSVEESDLFTNTIQLPRLNRSMEMFHVKPPPVDDTIGLQMKHRWYWASEMNEEEVWVLKIYDSKIDGRARRCPHTAIELPGVGDEVENRHSIEVRCLVFHEDEAAE